MRRRGWRNGWADPDAIEVLILAVLVAVVLVGLASRSGAVRDARPEPGSSSVVGGMGMAGRPGSTGSGEVEQEIVK
jgi:hypothetical protein